MDGSIYLGKERGVYFTRTLIYIIYDPQATTGNQSYSGMDIA